jgi:hypothetical protein
MTFIAAFVIGTFTVPAHGQGAPGPRPTPADLAAQLAALTARVGKLESGAVEAADFVGTYRLYSLGIELVPSIPGVRPAKVGPETGAATLTLRSDGTATMSSEVRRFNLVQGTWIVEDTSPVPEEIDLPWSYANGVLSLGSGGAFNIVAGAGGRILVAGTGNPVGGGGSWSQLLLAIRVP